MISTNIQKAKQELSKLISLCIKLDEIIRIETKDGNIIMISEAEYHNMLESLCLAGTVGINKDVEEAVNTPTSELIEEYPWK